MKTSFRSAPRSLQFLFAFALSVSALFGQGQRAYADADAKLTMELVQLVTPKETYDAMISQMTQQMLGSIQAGGGKQLPPDTQTKVQKAVTEAVPYNDLAQWTVEIYAARFTTEEIRQLLTFYKTPVGRKAARMLPEISGEVGKKLGPIMMQRLPAAMKKHGLTP